MTDEPIFEIETYIENRLVIAKGEGTGRRMKWEFGFSRCKLLYVEWNNNNIYCIAENYIQYPMINLNGKEYLKKNVYRYIYMEMESLCFTTEINTTW